MNRFEKGWVSASFEEDSNGKQYQITDRKGIQTELTEKQIRELGKALLKFYAFGDEPFQDKSKVMSKGDYDIFVEIEHALIFHAEIHDKDLRNSKHAKENDLLGEPCIAAIDCSSISYLDLPSIISDVLGA